MGAGSRISRKYARQTLTGILRLMKELGIWKGDITDEIREPIVAHKGDVSAIHTTRSGLFLSLKMWKNWVCISVKERI